MRDYIHEIPIAEEEFADIASGFQRVIVLLASDHLIEVRDKLILREFTLARGALKPGGGFREEHADYDTGAKIECEVLHILALLLVTFQCSVISIEVKNVWN